MRGLPVLLFLAVMLAGCSESPSAQEDDDVFIGLTEDVDVTTTSGAIAGVVVDEAIRPIANATVNLQNPARNTTTDSEGRFAFEGLSPGTYFVAAAAKRHLPTQVSADVVAGQASTVRILLVRMSGAEPYHTVLQFHGHIENYLGTANFAVEVFSPGTLACTCAFDFVPDANLTQTVIEAVGSVAVPNPGTPATVPGDAYLEVMEGNVQGGLITSGYTEFPVYQSLSGDESIERMTAGYGVRLTCGVWPCVTMDYDLFVTNWYHEPAPDGWSFVAGDT